MTTLLSTKIPVMAAVCSALLGSVVLAGWYLHAVALIQVFPQFAPMQYNTALGFLVGGIGLLAIINIKHRLSLACGTFLMLMGFLTLLQYILVIDLAIDQLLMDAYITVHTSHPGRMAPNTAVCFLLTGVALVAHSAIAKSEYSPILIEILSLLILAFSAMALAGYIIGEEKGYAWGQLTRMALHTTAGFIVLGIGIFAITINHRAQDIAAMPLWLPGLLCFIILLADLLFPKGAAIGVAYVPLVFCSLFFYYDKVAFIIAGLATVLIFLGYMASSSIGIDNQFVVTNRVLAIVAVWVTAIVVYLQKMTQKKLLKSEEALTLGWQGAGDGMWDWDVCTDTVMFSDRFKVLLGYKPEEIPHQFEEWSSRLHADDKDETLAALDQHIKNKTPYDVEYRLITKLGEWRWFLARGQALWDDEGNPTRMAGSLSDITERKENELKLRLLDRAVDHLTDVVVITEADPENPLIVYVNKASKLICGYSPEEMIGRTPSFLQGVKTDRIQLEALKQALKNQQAFSTELINYAKDGREYWIDINIVPITDKQGNTSHFAAIERDITASKLAKIEREELIIALEKSNDELDDFAYVASHDLKAPLRVIENVSHWLEEDLGEKLDEESIENMQLLRNRVNRMDSLLDDLLEYSRIGRKVDADYKEFVSGEDLIKDIILLVNMPKGFTVCASPEFLALRFNRMPLQLVILNLVSNAIKHHDKESGTVNVGIEEQENNYLMTVNDDGPGINPDFHQKIFKMFQTLKPRDRVEGSGMGLTIVRKHIELLGGTITLESAEGQGSTFSFTWPKQQTEKINQIEPSKEIV